MNALETYFRELSVTRSSGSAVAELSYYTALSNLLNEVGSELKPKVRCIINIKNRGAGFPDGGLFTPDQFQRPSEAEWLPGQIPARGVIEAKPTSDDAFLTADGAQVTRYWKEYRQVLVTNFRDFLLVGADAEGKAVKLEHYRLAPNEAAFWTAASHPRPVAAEQSAGFIDFLRRVMLHAASLAAPKDVAWFMASYAREALRRIEKRSEVPALSAIRSALEEALGIKFEDKKGEHFFRSTLVQTLFYGVFSAWVLWTRDHPPSDRKARFDWVHTGSYLRVPVLAELFHQVSYPGSLGELGLSEILDWTGTVLNRVDRAAFFTAFEEHHAVQYFYEPFLEAYDPELRKQLGVWYTPREVVRYMVARVDRVLRDELGLAEGLAAPNVYVLDPCCGTGSYLIEVLNRIAETLREKGGDALTAQEIKRAAMERVFGFEILPAPFVVTHLQIGLLVRSLGAPFSDAKKERAGVYLTNALTGWEPPDGSKPQMLLAFPELLQERDAAERVKQANPILVILGNPPYNAFAGVSSEQEFGTVDVYKDGLVTKWGIKKFNLDDLYVRFFRLAERKIAEQTGRGVVCFISNFSYLDNPSFVVMRKRFIEEFDRLWFDCMNGDSRETGKLTPDGKPDPSVFSTEYNREGIRVGTAIALLTRRAKHEEGGKVFFREFWGTTKRVDLLESLNASDFYASYEAVSPQASSRYIFVPSMVSYQYESWPQIPELAARHFNGPVERRGNSLIVFEGEEEQLALLEAYLDPKTSDDQIRLQAPKFMKSSGELNAETTRETLKGTVRYDESKIVRYLFKPFDTRRAYLDADIQPLFSRPSPELISLRDIPGIEFLITRDTADKSPEGPPFYFSTKICDYDSISGHARHFPTRLRDGSKKTSGGPQTTFLAAAVSKTVANLSPAARKYLQTLGILDPDSNAEAAAIIWRHALAVGYSPRYLDENREGIRDGWPRIPVPAQKQRLLKSADLGRTLADLLDADISVSGVTAGKLRPEIGAVATISRESGGSLNPEAGDLDVTVGWGHSGKGGAVMPGKESSSSVTTRQRSAKRLPAAPLSLASLKNKRSRCSASVPLTCT